jgi:dihydrofolate synthase/folylpolyglutamate synthase
MTEVFKSYEEAVQWLYLQLPQYQRQGSTAYKPGLERTESLMANLNHPERGFKSIHIAGTNGKGSTAHMLASVLQTAGYRVGLYTSPHLKDFRERIRINGAPIPESEVLRFVQEHASEFSKMGLSFFEMTVGLAFDYFAQSSIDIAIVETGMGGRLDSTNVITPILSIITNIGLDHIQFLGGTLEAIAGEKAGIIKPGVPVVIGQYTKETLEVFQRVAKNLNAPLIKADEQEYEDYYSDLSGVYQRHNKKTVQSAIGQLRTLGYTIDQADILKGLAQVQNLTGLMGRWQIIGQKPQVICDTAHNIDGIKMTMAQLEDLKPSQLHLVLGFVNDKALEEIFDCLPKSGLYYFCAANNPRAMAADSLFDLGRQKGLNGQVFDTVSAALQAAKSKATHNDVIYVGGSTFVVAEVL